jgi:hypothetical protein
MKDNLAELILAKVLGWSEQDVTQERPDLQAMATYKYDDYQQFSPGIRFIESLGRWLYQFSTVEERRIAYEFIKNRMLFISRAEMEHLVSTVYPDVIRPILFQSVAPKIGLPEYRIVAIEKSLEYKVLRRQSLFLGMSDGARTDVFRRSNQEIDYEQVYQTYEISADRADKMLASLKSDLQKILGRDPLPQEIRFKMVFLLDDFSGTGKTHLRKENGRFQGKIAKFYESTNDPQQGESKLIDVLTANIYIIHYVDTIQAMVELKKLIKELWGSRNNHPKVVPVHQINEQSIISSINDSKFINLCSDDRYYDADGLQDKNTEVGGDNVKFGFGKCMLPLVLAHNTPNDSIALLWAYENTKFRGLFPRVPRHKELS